MEKVVLTPTQKPTVTVAGLFAYDVPLLSGTYEFELIPEPDNPYDKYAISVRYHNAVVGYIPRDCTATYLPLISRIAASGKIAVVQGTYRQEDNGHKDLFLNLLADDNAIPNDVTLIPKSDHYNVPNAYYPMVTPSVGQKSQSIKANPLYMLLLFVLMIGVGFWLSARCSASKSNETKSGSNLSIYNDPFDAQDELLGWSKTDARNACHKEVEKQLTNPATAKFETMFEHGAAASADRTKWLVHGHVEVQSPTNTGVNTYYYLCTVAPSDEKTADTHAVVFVDNEGYQMP